MVCPAAGSVFCSGRFDTFGTPGTAKDGRESSGVKRRGEGMWIGEYVASDSRMIVDDKYKALIRYVSGIKIADGRAAGGGIES